jgi:hypothetical protein
MIDLGLPLALIASLIALYGVYLFNQVKDHIGARAVWFWSNSIFVAYFVGRSLQWWDGGLGDAVMATYFFAMWWSNWRGMA